MVINNRRSKVPPFSILLFSASRETGGLPWSEEWFSEEVRSGSDSLEEMFQPECQNASLIKSFLIFTGHNSISPWKFPLQIPRVGQEVYNTETLRPLRLTDYGTVESSENLRGADSVLRRLGVPTTLYDDAL